MPQHKANSKASDQIDENLRKVFQSISDEELPERLRNLMEELRKGESGSKPGNAQ